MTLTLIPVAIVIIIVVGQIVQNVLKLPVYLDSIGTVLVAVLAGPLAGAPREADSANVSEAHPSDGWFFVMLSIPRPVT